MNLKFETNIDPSGLFTYNATSVLSDYLRSLCKNEYSIIDTRKCLKSLCSTPPLQGHKEDVSHDVEPLLTNIPIEELINHIIEKIYVHKKLPRICSKLIFRWLLLKACYKNYF